MDTPGRRWYRAGFSASDNGVLVYDGGGSGNRQFAWFDGGGNLLATVAPRNNYNSPFTSFSLSPNERFLVVQRHEDPDTVLPTIWVIY